MIMIIGETVVGGLKTPVKNHEETAQYVDMFFKNLTSPHNNVDGDVMNMAFLYAARPDAAGPIYGPESDEVSILV